MSNIIVLKRLFSTTCVNFSYLDLDARLGFAAAFSFSPTQPAWARLIISYREVNAAYLDMFYWPKAILILNNRRRMSLYGCVEILFPLSMALGRTQRKSSASR